MGGARMDGSGLFQEIRQDHGPSKATNGPVEKPDEAILGNGQIRDRFQNERGIAVVMDRSRDAKLTEFGKNTLIDRYLLPGESFQDLFARK